MYKHSSLLWGFLCAFLLFSPSSEAKPRLEPLGSLHEWLIQENEETPSEPIWVEGEAFRMLLGSMEQVITPDEADALLVEAIGLRITRETTHSVAELFLRREFDLNLQSEDPDATGTLYRVHIPTYSRFELSGHPDGWIRVSGLHSGSQNMKFYIRLPFFPDGVFFREAQLDLMSGALDVVAGVLGNTIAVKAHAELYERSFEGIDFWDTLKLNFGRIGRLRLQFAAFRY